MTKRILLIATLTLTVSCGTAGALDLNVPVGEPAIIPVAVGQPGAYGTAIQVTLSHDDRLLPKIVSNLATLTPETLGVGCFGASADHRQAGGLSIFGAINVCMQDSTVLLIEVLARDEGTWTMQTRRCVLATGTFAARPECLIENITILATGASRAALRSNK